MEWTNFTHEDASNKDASLPFGEPEVVRPKVTYTFSFGGVDSSRKEVVPELDETAVLLKEAYLRAKNSEGFAPLKMYWPSNLDLEALVAANPPKFCKKIKVDKLKHIINLILTLRPRDTGAPDEGYHVVPLSAKRLQKVIHNYEDYLHYLVDIGVIVRHNRYIPGVQCKGYRLADKYQNQPLVEDRIKDEKVVNAIISQKKQRESRAMEQHSALRHWLDYLELDYDGASAKLVTEGEEHKHQGKIDRIRNKDWFFKLDDKTGRLHSNLTGLPSILRPYLRCQGQPLEAIDMGSAQPYLAICLFDPYFYQGPVESNRITIRQLFDNFRNIDSSPDVFEQLSLDALRFLEKNNAPQEEIEKYVSWVESGDFYQKFASHLEAEYGGKIAFDRKRIKVLMFKVLNSKDKGYMTRPKRLFKATFPFIYEIFHLLKRISHNHLAILLQALEAHIVLKRIVGRIARERPDVPVYTIHDCVPTISEHIEYIKSIMSEELYQAVGLYPPLKIESWE